MLITFKNQYGPSVAAREIFSMIESVFIFKEVYLFGQHGVSRILNLEAVGLVRNDQILSADLKLKVQK